MTPAINILNKNKIKHKVYKYTHDNNCKNYGQEVVDKLSISNKLVFKTLVVQLDDESLAVGILAVDNMLNMKQMAKALNTKKVLMAEQKKVENSTGYIFGGISPLGQKKKLKTIIDSASEYLSTIYISAGKRGLEIELNPKDLVKLLDANFSNISSLK